ncbi:MAG TPA: SDR family oxidoreductase [Desulfobacterales bacterium]|nr:SDR family oxidoreductase [Desulfobacterales bacterium]
MEAHNRVAVVTGAGTGIGKAVTLALLGDGYRVALAGRRLKPLEETAAESGRTGQTLVVQTDVTDEAAVLALFAQVNERFGRIDLLFNNAGVFVPGFEIDELTLEQWKSMVDVNLTGAFLCAREAFRAMKAQRPRGGRIINNGSISAHAPRPKSVPYTATKHAIHGLTKSLALDGRPYDIACGQIDIGNARTELAAPMAKGMLQADGRIATEPLLELSHVVSAVLYMANLPLDVNVQFMTIMPSCMPFIGRG